MEELAYSKIMCTNYMYWNLIYEKMMFNTCKARGYNFDKCYREWNKNYNQGIAMKHPEWTRPIYSHDNNKLPGGHCLSPNIHLDDNKISMILRAWEKGEILYCVTA